MPERVSEFEGETVNRLDVIIPPRSSFSAKVLEAWANPYIWRTSSIPTWFVGEYLLTSIRKSAFLLMQKLNGKNAEDLAKAAVRLLAPYKGKVHTITSENGTEFAEHQQIAEKLVAQFSFSHPYSSWERGINEITNKLLGQYIPKKPQVIQLYSL